LLQSRGSDLHRRVLRQGSYAQLAVTQSAFLCYPYVQDGYETVKQIRAMENPAKANVNIIAFTAPVNEQQKIFDSVFSGLLHKRLNMSDLREKLERAELQGSRVCQHAV
jgi:CheY-like chemotaxis protein